jgi:hypothetical protein
VDLVVALLECIAVTSCRCFLLADGRHTCTVLSRGTLSSSYGLAVVFSTLHIAVVSCFHWHPLSVVHAAVVTLMKSNPIV